MSLVVRPDNGWISYLQTRTGYRVERHAHAWDSERGGDLIMEKTWMERFVALLRPGASILDIGCGSGQPIARHLIEHGFHLAGIDSSPTVISLCGERYPDQEWLVADMRTLSLNRKFQGIIAWDSFFHLTPDQQRGFRMSQVVIDASAERVGQGEFGAKPARKPKETMQKERRAKAPRQGSRRYCPSKQFTALDAARLHAGLMGVFEGRLIATHRPMPLHQGE